MKAVIWTAESGCHVGKSKYRDRGDTNTRTEVVNTTGGELEALGLSKPKGFQQYSCTAAAGQLDSLASVGSPPIHTDNSVITYRIDCIYRWALR